VVVYRTLASVPVLVFAMFALSGSQASLGTDVAFLVLVGLVVPAFLVTLGATLLSSGAHTRARRVALADAGDALCMDNDKG
jgi:hypothetical protein